jgi:CRP/FNR family transcriptional regulator
VGRRLDRPGWTAFDRGDLLCQMAPAGWPVASRKRNLCAGSVQRRAVLSDATSPTVRPGAGWLLEGLAGRGHDKRYSRGQVLFRAGDEAKGLFVVIEGRVRVVRETAGRGQVVHEEGPGGTLGEVPLFTGCPYPATATATETTRCLLVRREAVRAALAADPDLAVRLLTGLALRVHNLITRLDRLAFSSVRARLAAWIAERARAGLGPVVSLGMTQERLAEELGTVREVVVRELAAVRRLGAIRSRGAGRLEILDLAMLDDLASGSAPSRLPEPTRGGAAHGDRRPSGGR